MREKSKIPCYFEFERRKYQCIEKLDKKQQPELRANKGLISKYLRITIYTYLNFCDLLKIQVLSKLERRLLLNSALLLSESQYKDLKERTFQIKLDYKMLSQIQNSLSSQGKEFIHGIPYYMQVSAQVKIQYQCQMMSEMQLSLIDAIPERLKQSKLSMICQSNDLWQFLKNLQLKGIVLKHLSLKNMAINNDKLSYLMTKNIEILEFQQCQFINGTPYLIKKDLIVKKISLIQGLFKPQLEYATELFKDLTTILINGTIINKNFFRALNWAALKHFAYQELEYLNMSYYPVLMEGIAKLTNLDFLQISIFSRHFPLHDLLDSLFLTNRNGSLKAKKALITLEQYGITVALSMLLDYYQPLRTFEEIELSFYKVIVDVLPSAHGYRVECVDYKSTNEEKSKGRDLELKIALNGRVLILKARKFIKLV